MKTIFYRIIPAVMILAVLSLISVARAGNDTKTSQSTAPPDWEARWVGVYGGADAQGKQGPPGFTTILPTYGNLGEPKPGSLDVAIVAHLKPWAYDRWNETEWELEDTAARCRPNGLFRSGAGGGFELLSSPGRITLVLYGAGGGGIDVGGIRRIYMDRQHPRNLPLTWNGDSIGRWDGDTLVIDTVGFNDKSWLSSDRERHSEDLHVVERMRFVANDTWMEHIWTITDPKALKSPYMFSRYHKKMATDTTVRENPCEDSPEARRGFRNLYNRALKAEAAEQAAAENALATPQPSSKP